MCAGFKYSQNETATVVIHLFFFFFFSLLLPKRSRRMLKCSWLASFHKMTHNFKFCGNHFFSGAENFSAFSCTRSLQEVSKHLILTQKKWEGGYLGQCHTCPFRVLSLGCHIFIPVSFPLFKTVCKVIFWDHHQLFHHILLNLIHVISLLGKTLGT